ncbi:hypothetical protein D3C75_643250 [compost metagenome]
MTTNKVTKQTGHPLEDIFGLPTGTTEVTVIQRKTELVAHNDFDQKDSEIEEQFQEVYDVAMSTFENQVEMLERAETDPKYIARQMEVAAQFLNTALSAANAKASLKAQKDKMLAAQRTTQNTVQGNVGGGDGPVVMSHSALLKMLKEAKSNETGVTIEGEVVKK